MNLPNGITEEEFITTVNAVCKKLVYKFKFGYHTPEDMQQQAIIEALDSINKWDGKRPLANFLYSCIHNGLFNYKRKHYHRPDKPCFTCPLYNVELHSQCEKYTDKTECDLYSTWMARNSTKKNIVQPIDISNIRDEQENNMRSEDTTEGVDNKEMWTLIDKHLDIKLRSDYIKIKNGIKIPKPRRVKVETAIIEIMKEHNDHWPQEG